MGTEQLSPQAQSGTRERALWIGLALLVSPCLPFVLLVVVKSVGLDLETAAIIAIGMILAVVATGTWIGLGAKAHGSAATGRGVRAGRRLLPWLCPTVLALWAFVIVDDAAVVPYSLILVPLAAVVIIGGPVATAVEIRGQSGESGGAAVQCALSVVRFPLSVVQRSIGATADSVRTRLRGAS